MSDNTPLLKTGPVFDSDSASESENYGDAESLQALMRGQDFYKSKRTGYPSLRRIYVSPSLQSLQIEKTDGGEVKISTIPTTEVLSIEKGFESRMAQPLLKKFFNCKQYGFRLFLRKGTVELYTDNRHMRDFWVQALNKLKDMTQQWSSHYGIKEFWISQCKYEGLKKDLLDLRIQKSRLTQELADCDAESTDLRFQIVEATREKGLNDLTKPNYEKILMHKYGNLKEAYDRLRVERYQSNSNQRGRPRRGIVTKRGGNSQQGWVLVLQMLLFKDLCKIKQLSTRHRDLVDRFLRNRTHWIILARGGLNSRKKSWPLYIATFYGNSAIKKQYAITEDTISEINVDIERSCSKSKVNTEEILHWICGAFEDVGYCQGMSLVIEFLFSVLSNNFDHVLGASMVLMRAPYFFNELWQPGLPRLKLLMYQLNALLVIKVPTLMRHFTLLDIQLDMFASSWLLTLFSSQESLERSVILRIWDGFWVDGWKAVISAALTLLHLSQSKF